MPECDYQLSEAVGDHRKGRGPLYLQKAEQGISGSVYEDLPGGSTLQGRTIAAKKILQIHQKVPILVSEKKETLWFPTVSATRDDCIWIHANEVVSYHAKGKRTQVIFRSKDEIELAIAYRTIQRQMRRCEQLRMYLRAHE